MLEKSFTYSIGVIFKQYDVECKTCQHKSLSILKAFGFGNRQMESRIQIEVADFIDHAKSQNGRPFNPTLTIRCQRNSQHHLCNEARKWWVDDQSHRRRHTQSRRRHSRRVIIILGVEIYSVLEKKMGRSCLNGPSVVTLHRRRYRRNHVRRKSRKFCQKLSRNRSESCEAEQSSIRTVDRGSRDKRDDAYVESDPSRQPFGRPGASPEGD